MTRRPTCPHYPAGCIHNPLRILQGPVPEDEEVKPRKKRKTCCLSCVIEEVIVAGCHGLIIDVHVVLWISATIQVLCHLSLMLIIKMSVELQKHLERSVG